MSAGNSRVWIGTGFPRGNLGPGRIFVSPELTALCRQMDVVYGTAKRKCRKNAGHLVFLKDRTAQWTWLITSAEYVEMN